LGARPGSIKEQRENCANEVRAEKKQLKVGEVPVIETIKAEKNVNS